MCPFFDGDDTNVCGLIFSSRGSPSTDDFLLATGELPVEDDAVVAAAAFFASINILDASFDASGDFLNSFNEVLLLIEAELLDLVPGVVVVLVGVEDDVLVVVVSCFLENVE